MSSSILRRFLQRIHKVGNAAHVICRGTGTQTPRSTPGTKPKSFWEGGYYLLVFPATSMYLCYWQLQRRKWKLALIQDLEDKRNASPVPLPENLEDLKDKEFQPVMVRGHFDYEKEVFIGPRSDVEETSSGFSFDGNRVTGVHVITPFQLADRDMRILVDRGWYSLNKFNNKKYREKGRVYGEMEIIGNVRHDQAVNSFIKLFMGNYEKPAMKHEEEVYLVRTLGVLAERCHTEPVFIEATNARLVQEAPQSVEKSIALRNTHMEYAITWFALAVVTFALWVRNYRSPKRLSAMASVISKTGVDKDLPK